MRLCGWRASSPDFGQPFIRLGFSDEVDPEFASKFISTTPPVSFSTREKWFPSWGEDGILGADCNNVVLSGDFIPGKKYQIHIAGGLESRYGQKFIGNGKTFEVLIPDREPGVRFLSSAGRYLVPNGSMILPFQAVNVTNIHISVSKILPQNLLQFVMRESGRYDNWFANEEESHVKKLVRPVGECHYPVKYSTNEQVLVACSLAKIIGKEGHGAYFVNGGLPEGNGVVSKVVCVTDFGISAKVDKQAVYVLVTSLTTARPRAGVKVSVLSDCNEEIGSVRTGADGQARIPFAEDVSPIAVIVRDLWDGDVSFLPLTQRSSVPVPKQGANYVKSGECDAFVYTERGIYRPGEKVFCESLIRNHKQVAPEPFPVVLKLFGIRGDLLRTIPLMPDATGSASTSIVIPEAYQLGSYRLDLCTPGKKGKLLGSTSFKVESIVPPQIRVDVVDFPKRVDISKTGALAATISSSYLFGSPAAGLSSTATLELWPTPFTSPKWPGYHFADITGKKAILSSQTLKSVKLDKDGKASYTFLLKNLEKENTPVTASFKALVLEPGGRARPAVATGLVDTRPWYIGLCGKEVVQPDSQVSFDWALVKPDGSLHTGEEALSASLVLEDSTWSCKVNEQGQWVWEYETRDVPVFFDRPVPANQSGRGCYSFPAPEADWGDYRFTISDQTGNRSSVRFHVSFWDGDSQTDPAAFSKIELKPDRESYQVGDTASIHVTAPFDGSLWLVVQNDSVLQSTVIPLGRKETTVRLPITEALTPDVKLSATVLRPVKPEEIWAPHRSSGQISLSVRPLSKVLDVGIVAPTNMVPASKLVVSVGVTNRASGPVEDGTATIMVVDEALCLLTDLATPSPVDFFFREHVSGILYYDIFSDLMQVTDETLLGFRSHAGGDESQRWNVRLNPIKSRRFKPLSLVKANVPVRDGKAVAAFDIPEFAGQVRIMAVAHTREATGSSESRTTVRRNLIVQPDMPRCLAPGDKTELTVALFNQLPEKANVKVSVRCEGPLAVVSAPAPLTLPAKGSRSLVVPIRVLDQVGAAKVILDVHACGEHYSQTIDIPVRPTSAWETSNSSFLIPAGRSVLLAPAKDIVPSSFRQEIDITAFPVADVRSAIDYLVAYPYGCLEQTTSKAYPFLQLASLPEGIVPNREEYDPSVRVKAAIARIALSRRGNQGFSMWSDCLPVHCGGSLYAIQFLAEAIRAGYDTGEMTRETLREMVKHIHGWKHFDESKIVLCLALLEKPDYALMARLSENPELTVEQTARVALTYLVAGKPADGRKLLVRAGSPNSLQSAAILLEAWTKLDPKSPQCAECIEYINKARNSYCGHWLTTQRNALVARAFLTSLAATGAIQTNQAIQVRSQIEFNGKKEAIALPANKNHLTISEKRNGSVLLYNDGKNDLHVRRSIHAVPLATKRPAVQHGLGVFRNYYTPEGYAVDLSKVKRGDSIVVELVAVPTEETSDLIIEDLLPACLEVESIDLAKLNTFPWIRSNPYEALHAEARDDRVLVFPDTILGKAAFKWYYLARVVTAGEYAVPALHGEAMYKPEVFARGEEKRISIFRE